MNPFVRFLNSSIGRKVLMALTGLALTLFLIGHMLGNLTIYAGNDTFNEYAVLIEGNPALPLVEIGLVVLFGAHIVLAFMLIKGNRQARSVDYRSRLDMGAKTLASRTMWISGPVLLVFLLIHLWDFRIGKEFVDAESYDLAQMVVDRLRSPLGFAIYVVGVGFVGLHLWHAFASSFQTLGVTHPRYRRWIKYTGRALAILLVAGFGGIPFYLFFTG